MREKQDDDIDRRRFVRKLLVAGGMLTGTAALTGGIPNVAQAQPTTTTTTTTTTTAAPSPVPVLGAVALAGLTVAVGSAAVAKLKRDGEPG